MRMGFLTAAGLAAALILTGCGKKGGVEGTTGAEITSKSSAKEIGAAYLNELTSIADALETVEDEASARAAAKKLKTSIDGLNTMKEELDGELTGMKAMQVFGGRYTDLIEVQARLAAAVANIQANHPELMDTVSDELDRLDN